MAFSLVLLFAILPCAVWAIPTSGCSVSTPLGSATGVTVIDGASRYAVRYATATRWAPSTLVTEWNLPNGSDDPAALPLACPQPDVDPSTYTEDCLSMILYVPKNIKRTTGAPTLMWIHGGSFDAGSATLPGFDGSNLAIATQSIVAVIQYRLGALGLLAPDGSTNLAVKDTITALKFLAKVVPSFGGDSKKITLAGQSSGANMIRLLLAAPSASSLFQNAILQSDPIGYGFLSMSTQKLLQNSFNDLIYCSANDTACLASLTLDAILEAQVDVRGQALDLDPSTGRGEPFRPVQDGQLITSPLDSTAPFPRVNKPLLLTNVLNEAGFTIYKAFDSPIPTSFFEPTCELNLGPERTQIVLDSPYYPLSDDVDTRIPLMTLGTDYIWRCSAWTLARQWVAHGGSAFVGMYTVGATYPTNSNISICLESGSVCHQDDIEIVFGTVPDPTPEQAALTVEMQTRYKAFMRTGSPNVPGLAQWAAATTMDVHAKQLGLATTPNGEVPVGACDPAFWGAAVEYDYQFFNI